MVNKQKFNWVQTGKLFNTYEEAKIKRDELLESNNNIKIKRCGRAGTKFKIKVGTPVKKEEKKKPKKKNKK